MTDRTTITEINFPQPFFIEPLQTPLPAGTYRLTIDEELIEGVSFAAFRQTSARLEIPALEVESVLRQAIEVNLTELGEALFSATGEGLHIEGIVPQTTTG